MEQGLNKELEVSRSLGSMQDTSIEQDIMVKAPTSLTILKKVMTIQVYLLDICS